MGKLSSSSVSEMNDQYPGIVIAKSAHETTTEGSQTAREAPVIKKSMRGQFITVGMTGAAPKVKPQL